MPLSVVLFPEILLAYTRNQQKSGETTDVQHAESASIRSLAIPDTVITAIDFASEIAPIFKARCSPCHFPGGKMYSKLPFDSAQTIINHPEGILRRIKDPDESKKIRDFIELADKH